jgi:hypothetical protein
MNMDIRSAEELLHKINRLFAEFQQNPVRVSQLEKSLMQDYLREMYDALLAEVPMAETKSDPPRPEAPPPAAQPKQAQEPSKKRIIVTEQETVEKKTVSEDVQPLAKEKPHKDLPLSPPSDFPTEKIHRGPTTPPESKPVEAKPVAPPVPVSAVSDFDKLFDFGPIVEISEKLALSPISELKFSINDRLLYLGSLFKNDNVAFDAAIAELNRLDNLEAAREYIRLNLLAKFDWMEEEKRPMLQSFIKLLRRRYLHQK